MGFAVLKKILSVSGLLTAICLLSACTSSTQLTASWYDETYTAPEGLQKVLVLGVFKNDIDRRAFETEFTQGVIAAGGDAVAGYSLMPEETDYDDEQDISDVVNKIGADAVLITSYEGTTEQQRYVPPSVDYVPAMGYGFYGPYYGATYRRVYSPGYTVVDSIVNLETRVYAVEPEKLIWAGKTRSVNASSGQKISEELVKVVVDDMRASGLVAK